MLQSFIHTKLQTSLYYQVLAINASIDTVIINAAGINSLDFFYVTPDRRVMLKTELDLVLSPDQYKGVYVKSKDKQSKRKALSDLRSRWPGAVVYYETMKDMGKYNDVLSSAMNTWSEYTCLSFQESKTAGHRVQFMLGNSCWSYLGMNQEGVQQISLNPSCVSKEMVLHMIGHTIGFIHEHMRPDRDKYISVNMDKVPLQSMINFGKMVQETVTMYGIEYDYSSIMHYESQGIITTLDSAYQTVIGKVKGLSFKDIKMANIMYDCAAKAMCPSKQCPFNGFVFSKPHKGSNKCECWCQTDDKFNVDPLVLCSSITKEAQGYSLREASSESSSGPICSDLRENCGVLKDKGFCEFEFKKMKSFCPKTCNFCDKGKDICMDIENGCDLMARAGACNDTKLKDVAFTICPKSCDRCKSTSSGCDIQKALGSG